MVNTKPTQLESAAGNTRLRSTKVLWVYIETVLLRAVFQEHTNRRG